MLNVRIHGPAPYDTVLLHGGPGAPGEMEPVAMELSKRRGVLEPLQSAASLDGQEREVLLALEQHAALPAALVGHSWGAWLGYIFAARHPGLVKKLVLVGSGPFEESYVHLVWESRMKRLNEGEQTLARSLLDAMEKASADDDTRVFGQFGTLMAKADSFDPITPGIGAAGLQPGVYRAVMREALEVRRSGGLLALGRSIECPVIAIHGDHDPHPGEGVREPLSRVLKNFRFILLPRCGHDPWNERHARERFYRVLEDELERGASAADGIG
jgi:pimeloyl-ACP methyl ester carboxylesterase